MTTKFNNLTSVFYYLLKSNDKEHLTVSTNCKRAIHSHINQTHISVRFLLLLGFVVVRFYEYNRIDVLRSSFHKVNYLWYVMEDGGVDRTIRLLAESVGPNGRLSSSCNFFNVWLIKTWCPSN